MDAVASALLATWTAALDMAEPTQAPADELLAEHALMRRVLDAMELQAEAMLRGSALQPEFWHDLVDFHGNFVHLCHRVKEEIHLVPELVAAGRFGGEQAGVLHREHENGKQFTLELCDAVGAGDWERTTRLVAVCTHVLRPHMAREEDGVFVAARGLDAAATQRLRTAFTAVERRALGAGGRRHHLDVARRLVHRSGASVGF